MSVEVAVFAISAVIVMAGALGVITASNPVHSALSLVATLFGIAVLFVAQDAQFLAAVQVIVYAGAIVVLFLFVIMLLGVDRSDDLDTEPLVGQRVAAIVSGLVVVSGLVAILVTSTITGAKGSAAPIEKATANVNQIGKLLFTDYLFAFEITSVLLVIAVVGAVMLARGRSTEPAIDTDEPVTELARPRPAEADDAEVDA